MRVRSKGVIYPDLAGWTYSEAITTPFFGALPVLVFAPSSCWIRMSGPDRSAGGEVIIKTLDGFSVGDDAS